MTQRRTYLAALVCASFIGGAMLAAAGDPQSDQGMEVLHGAHIMHVRQAAGKRGGSAELVYQGGTNGIGVIAGTTNRVVLVYWGSQWVNNDPSGEADIQQNFFHAVGGSVWNNSVTQYCEGVQTGTVYCGVAGVPAGNSPVTVVTWSDNAAAAPSHPTQAQIAAEAVRAAQVLGFTTADVNAHVQYVINTPTGNSSRGFGVQYCAYHSSTTSSYGNLAYTNMPYLTDAGANCGANFNGLGATAGITIVGGHEFAETETDIYPNTGWLDRNGAENGDKCAWITSGQGAAANVVLDPNNAAATTFPVQSLWSDAFNNNTGGCVLSY